ncbi:Hypp960 [Branchiostoma lanceolatum]|uniref:Hypp960 protein n=1 Tax=Branchiostoma lanceolatum TaxID=7740 RepID=A0A8J9ZDJ5_BRALA|nr:Hypp960 [Branchiostoma lanceolatum]
MKAWKLIRELSGKKSGVIFIQVLTPEGETDFFKIDTGVLQGDPLAYFLFIIVLDYALRKAINADDGLTLQRRRSSRHPAVVISDLDFADDIGLLEDTIQAAQDLLYRKRRLALAGHVARHEEMAAKVLLWEPDAKRKRGRPNLTLKKVLEEEVGLKDYNLLAAMLDRNAWLDIVNGTSYEDDLN